MVSDSVTCLRALMRRSCCELVKLGKAPRGTDVGWRGGDAPVEWQARGQAGRHRPAGGLPFCLGPGQITKAPLTSVSTTVNQGG